MTTPSAILPLLVFEAAGCLMAVPASEVARLESADEGFAGTGGRAAFDLGEYFVGRASDGPWLHWDRGARSAWLRVMRVVDVVPIALSALTPMPSLLLRERRTRAFLAAGISGKDVFLLLDPARLSAEALRPA